MQSTRLIEIICLASFMCLPAILPSWALSDFAIYFTYAIFAASLSFLWGHAGLLSLGHAVYFGIGAYAMSAVTLGMLPMPAASILGLIIAIILPGLVAFALGSFFFASKELKGAFFGIVTLALAFIFERIAINTNWLGGMNGLMNVPPVRIFSYELYDPIPLYFALLVILAITIFALNHIKQSRFGLALAALRANELRAATLGHDTSRLKTFAFSLSGMIAGLAGALFVTQFGFASPSLIGFSLSAEVLIWVALGGRTNILAASLGAIAVRFLESQLSGALGNIWPLLACLLFMLSVLALTSGHFGEIFARLSATRNPNT